MRKTASSGNTRCSTAFSSATDAWSRPKGFSTTTREPGPASPAADRPSTTSSYMAGRMAR